MEILDSVVKKYRKSLFSILFALIGLFASGQWGNVWLNEDEYYERMSNLLESVKDIVERCDSDGFENNLGNMHKFTDKANKERVRIDSVNRTDIRMLDFLAWILDIDLYEDFDYSSYHGNSPLMSSLREINDFNESISFDRYKDQMYKFWLIYNLYDTFMNRLMNDPQYIKIITSGSTTESDEDALLKFAQDNPNSYFARSISIFENLQKQYKSLNGILRCNDIPQLGIEE